jgi:hypothetical protein
VRTLALALAALALAGCLSSPAPAPLTSDAASMGGGWRLDCALGSHERAADATWAQACEARASHSDGSKAEMWLAVNPTDPRNVVIGSKDLNPASSKGCVWNGLGVTHDGGATWRDVVIGGNDSDRRPGDPFWGYACNTDPMFQFTADGDLHYGVEMYNLLGQNAYGIAPENPASGLLAAASVIPGWKILLATSHDGGDTWPDVITYQPDLVVVTDYSRMTVNPATQSILEMIGSAAGNCHVLASRDGGRSADLFAVPASPNGIPCQAIAASPEGAVVLVGDGLLFGGGGLGSIVVARSDDDGATWLDSNAAFTYQPIGQFQESQYRVGSGMELAYDLSEGPRRGTLYALYAAADRDEADVYIRASPDDGVTWGEGVLVNTDEAGPHQWMGNLVVAGDSSVHVFFLDKRYDPAHALIDVTHAVSFDGGETWTNERVSTVGFDGDLGVHQEGFPFIGDYLGVASAGNEVWAGFPDASGGGVPVIAAARVTRS